MRAVAYPTAWTRRVLPCVIPRVILGALGCTGLVWPSVTLAQPTVEAELQGGPYGRIKGGLQFGAQNGDFALYVEAQGSNENGWRQHSPAQLARIYADIGWRRDRNEVHLVLSGASNFFGVTASAPIELLQRDWTSVYTFPQTTRNRAALAAINGEFRE